MSLTRIPEWEGELVRLVRLGGLKLHPNFPHGFPVGAPYAEAPARQVVAVFVHQLAGPFGSGDSAAMTLAHAQASSPFCDEGGEVLGGGKGLPGAAPTFLVPFRPDSKDGKLEVYRLWDDTWVTDHTGPDWNHRSVAVAFGGSLRSRHVKEVSSAGDRDPSQTQFLAGKELIEDFLLPRYGLDARALRGGFDAGQPASPGDVLEAWIRKSRGESVEWLEIGRAPWDDRDPEIVARPKSDRRTLETWTHMQQALVELGYELGDMSPDATSSALRSFQRRAGIVVNGMWDTMTETHIRLALANG